MATTEIHKNTFSVLTIIDRKSNIFKTELLREEKIAFARQFYNDTVLTYMNKIQMFPSNIFASMFGFKEEKYFEAGEEVKEAPKVSF